MSGITGFSLFECFCVAKISDYCFFSIRNKEIFCWSLPSSLAIGLIFAAVHHVMLHLYCINPFTTGSNVTQSTGCMTSIIRPSWRRPTYCSVLLKVPNLGCGGDGPRTERVKACIATRLSACDCSFLSWQILGRYTNFSYISRKWPAKIYPKASQH